MALPEDATTVDEGTTREYSVVREHDGYEVINSILSENGLNILFKSDKFSKFIISYVDTALQPSPEPSVEPSPEPSVEPSAIPTPEQKNEDSKAVGSNPITSDDIVIWMIIFGITTIAYIIINKKDQKGKRAK